MKESRLEVRRGEETILLLFLSSCCILSVSCSKSDATPAFDAKSNVVTGTLAVDIRQTVDVTLTPRASSADFDAALVFGDGDFQYFDAHGTLRGVVTAEPFPEAQMTMYVATFSAPPRASSPCADQPITLTLSLVRRGSNARVGGGLTAYCGANKTSGVPARVLRLNGDLPLP